SDLALARVSDRANALTNALARANALGRARANDLARARTGARDLANALANARTNDLARANALGRARANALALARTCARDLARTRDLARIRARRDEADRQVFFLADGLDFGVISSELEDLEKNLLSLDTSSKEWQRYTQRILALPKKIFEFNRGILAISPKEWDALAKHLTACKLIADCKDAATNVSPEIWEEIESALLAPEA
ncbi:MAG: hypothetical protein AAFY11_10400, partial [Cyanobacteria bacterium J06641_5]